MQKQYSNYKVVVSGSHLKQDSYLAVKLDSLITGYENECKLNGVS